MARSNTYKLAVIPGDGIGKEVMPEGLRVLEAAARKYRFSVDLDHHDFSSWDYYEKHGRMMPEDWKAKIGGSDAIFFGAVGMPDKIPDHISLWGSLLLMRREFDQYVNLRPVKLMPGVPSPLANRKPATSTSCRAREHRGRVFLGRRPHVPRHRARIRAAGDGDDPRRRRPHPQICLRTRHEAAAQEADQRHQVQRHLDLDALLGRARRRDEEGLSDVAVDQYHIDILTAHFVLNPDRFDVVVASNLFGDILSDLGPACTGTIGIAPSGNINPDRKFPSLFEPVHGSAPDIAGKGIANPIGQIWSAAMMLDHLGEPEAAAAIVRAIEEVLAKAEYRTRDLGGTADTVGCGKAVADALA